MEPLTDNKVKEHFKKLVTNFLSKNDNYNMSNFIGGLPITLERKNMEELILPPPPPLPGQVQADPGKSKYSVTQKIDGTRYLMYIGPVSSSTKKRSVCFIDRNMEIYTLAVDKYFLREVNTREMLLDGEIVFFDRLGESPNGLAKEDVKGVSFMAFDILFGPESVDYFTTDEKTQLQIPKIGQEFSFMLPEDGKQRAKFPWNYASRYEILQKLIEPSDANKNKPILIEQFKDVDWFTVELKPIYHLTPELFKDRKNPADEFLYKYLEKDLTKKRIQFYNLIGANGAKKKNILFKKPLNLDGLIFTASDTLYKIGSWNMPLSSQYKWKPPNEQTVDLLINKISDNEANVFMSMGGGIVAYKIGPPTEREAAIVTVPQWAPHGDIAEFGLERDGNFKFKFKFKFKGLRKDKTYPNSLRTVMNVINSFKNPVNIDDLYYFLTLSETPGKEILEKVLEYSSRSKLLRCAISKKKLNMLNSFQVESINKLIKSVNTEKDTEVELRFGKMKGNFNPEIDPYVFMKILNKVDNHRYKKEIEYFLDIYDKDVRTRYIYSNDFGKYILLESIIKKRQSNVDIPISHILDFDVRISKSSETKTDKYNSDGNAIRKHRTSYTIPEGLFRIDFTSIKPGIYSDRSFEPNDTINEKFQIEIEFLSNNIDVNELFKFISNMLDN